MVSPKEKNKIKSVSGQESASLLHISSVQTQANDMCILKVWTNSLFLNFTAFHNLGGWDHQGMQRHQNRPRIPNARVLLDLGSLKDKLFSMIFTHVALLYPSQRCGWLEWKFDLLFFWVLKIIVVILLHF